MAATISATEGSQLPLFPRRAAILRTRSSPILSPVRGPPLTVASTVLESLPLPVLVFEPSLRIYSVNNAGRVAFGMPDEMLEAHIGPGGAEQFFWATASMAGSTPDEKLRNELVRLSRRSQESTLSATPASLECKSGAIPGLRWRAEVAVSMFTPDRDDVAPSIPPSSYGSSMDSYDRHAHWFTVVLVKTVARPTLSSEQTPTLGSTANPLASWHGKVLGEAVVDEDGSEGAWRHEIPQGGVSRAAFTPLQASMPLRLATLPAMATPPLSSTSSKLSSRSSLLSTASLSSASSVATSQSLRTDLSPAAALATAKLVGMGVSVTSSGIHLTSEGLPSTVEEPSTQDPSPPSRGLSPRPTSLPPPLPPLVPSKTHLLQFAALASLPDTGVIVADPELTTGFVNPLAREILLGAAALGKGGGDAGWWDDGTWLAEDLPTGQSSASGSTSRSEFFPTSSHGDTNPFEAKDLLYSSIIAAGNAQVVDKQKGTGGSSLRIGKPSETNRYRTTVAGILARSVASASRRAASSEASRWMPEDIIPTPGGSRRPRLPTTASSSTGRTIKKPYRIFDASWSQRIIDPLEPLLEICIRRGETPASFDAEQTDEGGAMSGMIVGIEVEVLDSEASFTVIAGKRKRVRRRLVEISAAPIYEPAGGNGVRGRHLGGMLLLRDVTDEQKKHVTRAGSGQSKRNGEAHFKHIVDNLPQLVWTTTPLGSHDYFNKGWYDFTNLEPEQSLGLGWQSPFHEDDIPATVKAWSHSLATGDPYSVEYRCRRYDGEWRWMLGRALPCYSTDGKIQSWFGTCTDVHEFVQIRTELAKTQERFRELVAAAEVLIWALDTTWRINFFEGSQKAALANALFPAGGNLVGSNFKEVWPKSTLTDALEAVMSGASPSRTIEWLADIKANRYYRCSITPLLDQLPDGSSKIGGVITVAVDVTESSQLRVEGSQLRASEEAAQEASRLKSEFLANQSHEMRTPVAGMIGLAELLQAEPDLKEEHRVQVSKIIRTGEILLELVGMVLDMGKVEAGKLELEHRPFKIDTLVSDARLFSTVAQKKGLQFIEEVGSIYPGNVMGDMSRLRQILTNLLSNAIKFTSRGSVTLRVALESETPTVARMRFEVHDTGIGVKPEVIGLLFKPFQQADSSTSRLWGGSGLGLCIAKNLVELMGGTIDLSSRYGHGSNVIVVVPLEKAPDVLPNSPSAVPSPDLHELVREDKWILVADDNSLNREIITKTLTKMRFNVRSAANGLEAIAAITERHYDLIVMDGQMPEMDGYEATEQIRRSPDPDIAQIKIIALTASAIRGDEERCLQAGMDDYLSKPVRAKLLEATVVKHLSQLSRRRPSLPKRASSPSPSPSPTSELYDLDLDLRGGASTKRKLSHPSYQADVDLLVATP